MSTAKKGHLVVWETVTTDHYINPARTVERKRVHVGLATRCNRDGIVQDVAEFHVASDGSIYTTPVKGLHGQASKGTVKVVGPEALTIPLERAAAEVVRADVSEVLEAAVLLVPYKKSSDSA